MAVQFYSRKLVFWETAIVGGPRLRTRVCALEGAACLATSMALAEDFVDLLCAFAHSCDEVELVGAGIEAQAREIGRECLGRSLLPAPHSLSYSTDRETSGSERGKHHRCSTDKDEIREVRRKGGVYVNNRRDGRQVVHSVLPRILKSDIRRNYPRMVCNLYNSDDPSRVLEFCQVYSSPNLVFDLHTRYWIKDVEVARELSVSGWDTVSKVWNSTGELMPDKSCRLLGALVRARSDGTGQVQYMTELTGTVVIQPEQPAPWLHVDPRYGQFVDRLLGAEGGYSSISTTVLVRVTSTMTVTLQLDSDNRILSAHMLQGAPVVQRMPA